MKLSIVTVTYQNIQGLQETYESLVTQLGSFEWIVVDGGSSDGTREFLQSCSLISKWVSEKDAGIYDAMNKGLGLASGDGVLFLNAGDRFVGQVIQHVDKAPGLIPVETQRLGYKRMIRKKNRRMGMPYCHQGIVFSRSDLRYDLSYRIASDYDYYLRHDYSDLPFLLPQDQAAVFYDNRGVSAQKWWIRDREIARIVVKNFGLFWGLVFGGTALTKGLIKSGLSWCVPERENH